MAPPINNFSPDTSLTLLKAQQASNDLELKKSQKAGVVGSEFEAVMLSEMLKPMFEGIEVDDMFGGGKGEEIFRGFMIQEYGKIMAKAGGIGIADAVKQHLIQIQSGESNDDHTHDAIDVTGVEINAKSATE